MQDAFALHHHVEIVDFWRNAQHHWFAQSPSFDRHFAARFEALHLAAARRQLEHWSASAYGALALLILLDQYPRNAYRGTAHMYATDHLARCYARTALTAELDWLVEEELRLFFYLPFSHSESLADQRLAVTLNRRLGQPWLNHAENHCAIIERFGRFPHRNSILGRSTSDDERAFLDADGFSG